MEKGIKEVLEKHQGLEYYSAKNTLEGELFLSSGDSYEVLINLNPYPRFFPTVKETGGRIPPKADRHIYEQYGTCCFTTSAKSQILLKTEISSLLKFIDEIVIRYFENNSYYEIHGHYFGEEYNHGIEGILEGYQDILEINDLKIVLWLIHQRIENQKLRPNDLCYCGSGIKIKKCHPKNYGEFRLIEKMILKKDFEKLISSYKIET